MNSPVYIVDGVRTPIGKFRGGLKDVRADDLAAHVIRALCERVPEVVPQIDHVIFGATNQAGEDNRNVARMAALLAGLPYEVPAVTVNRLCGSGLEAIQDGARMIALGEASVVIAGGVENMTRAPYSMPKAEEAFSRTPPPIYDTVLGWRYPNPALAARFPLISMGETAELVADKYKISREDQDAWALRSQQRALDAWERGLFTEEVVPLPIAAGPATSAARTRLERDESPRATQLEALAKLAPVFRQGGTVTAGNSSPLSDGSAAVLLVNESIAKTLSRAPVMRWVASAAVGVHPSTMGEGPIPATRAVLARAGLTLGQIDNFELNEAFAAQVLACVRTLDLAPDLVNVRGGAIALGHPIGCSGARIVVTMLHHMKASPSLRRGLASACIGVGQGIAGIFERAC